VGEGGMGRVFEAERIESGERIAVKVVRNESDGIALARFAREAALALSVDHPNVVRVFDVRVSTLGTLTIEMELVAGHSLAEESDRFGDVPWAVAVLRQIAAGLVAIHEAGIVHRDLKPGNVLLSYADSTGGRPHVRVSDFGVSTTLAHRRGPDGSAHTETATASTAQLSPRSSSRAAFEGLTADGALVGTLKFMAPETAEGDVTTAADSFSLGVMAFQMLTGVDAFETPAVRSVLVGQTVPVARRLRTVDATIAPRLDDLVFAALAESPTHRPSAREWLDALSAVEASLGASR